MTDVALVGAGRIGKIHGANLARQPGMRLRYVCDAVPAAAEELAARLGAAFCDLDRAFSGEVKAVVIASSTDTHADLILRAAAAGKAIFCEKPVDLDLHPDFDPIRKTGSGTGYNAVNGTDAISIYTGGNFGWTQYSQAKILASNDNVSIIVRAEGASGTSKLYSGYSASGGGSNWYISYYDGNGNWYNIASVAGTPQVNDIVRLEIVGYKLTLKVNGTPVLSVVDTTYMIAGPGYAGIGVYDNVLTIDDWEGGNFSPVIAPPEATASSGAIAPTVQIGGGQPITPPQAEAVSTAVPQGRGQRRRDLRRD